MANTLATHVTAEPARGVAARLDELAAWVAQRLDAGDDEGAWVATRRLEADAGYGDPETYRPAGPVIGRRFAAAHRRLLAAAVVDLP